MTADILRAVAVLVLIAATGLFTLAEYALVTARRWRLQQLADAGDGRANRVIGLMDQPMRFIATVQLAVGGLGILIGAIGEPALRRALHPPLPNSVAFVIGVVLITFLTVLLGDLIPKAIALQRAEGLALTFAPLIQWFGRAAFPIVWALQRSADLMLRPFGIHPPRAQVMALSEDDLRGILGEAEASGVIEETDEELLYSVFDFASAEVREVMVPRGEIVGLEASQTVDEAVGLVLDAPFAWHPVYAGDLDHIVGVVELRDLFTAVHRGSSPDALVATLVRPVATVRESQDLGALLAQFRQRHHHLAIVADAAGATLGIVTLEDVVEHLIGEIAAEFELPDEAIDELDAHTVEVSGTFPISDFCTHFAVQLPATRFHALGGLVFDQLGRVAVVGDALVLGGLRFEVRQTDGPRIRVLRVRLLTSVAA